MDIIIKQLKSVKLPNPPLLLDSIDPTFKNWRIQVQRKFYINYNYFPSKETKMLYLFGWIIRDA